MKTNVWLIALVLLFLACNGNKTDDKEQKADSTQLAEELKPDSVAPDTATPPAAADGLFDDFAYNFMRNKRFQYERIKFPLPVTENGKTQTIEREAWKFDRMYAHQDVYTMLFDSEKSINAEKSHKLTHVTVEFVYLKKKRVKQYTFDKLNGQWMLVGIDTHHLSKNVNSDFFSFYYNFANNTTFQTQHISNPFEYKTYDSDSYQEIDGVLDVAQWPDYKPELPTTFITNINYGQSYSNRKRRVLVITTPSAGMSCMLSFKKGKGGWTLVRMENI